MTKYQPLYDYLASRQHLPRVRMTFAEISQVLGAPLPKSAFTYREWWANQTNTARRPHAAAWQGAGFEVASLHQDSASGYVEFVARSWCGIRDHYTPTTSREEFNSMPDSVDLLQRYLKGVMERAAHHANDVDEVSLTIAGAVVWRKDGEIEVMTQDGDMKNVLWVHISGKRYALSYNHHQGCVEVRERSTQGKVLASFTNANSASDVKAFFGGL